ncbi:hypothetical protein ACFRJ9_09320 [Paenarthrobacter sp. NPDC056912]|uniref:hypothetical protein n=1 Tax=Paenarthrobacter sp. NPDC056912 TaxID=3345965 RepID=UPI00366D53F1
MMTKPLQHLTAIPSSTGAIEASNPDVPNDPAGTLFDGGFGLRHAVVPQEL